MRTLALASGIMGLALCLCLCYVYFTRKTYPGFRTWTLGLVVGAVGTALLGLRAQLPDLVTVVLANLCLMAAVVLLTRGLAHFCEARQHNLWDGAILVLVTAAYWYFTLVHPDLNTRVALLYLLSVPLWLRCFAYTWRGVLAVLPRRNLLLALSFAFLSLWSLGFAGWTYFFDARIVDYLHATPVHGVGIVVGMVFRLFVILGLIGLNAQRLELDLHQADREIEFLRGLLPVCANCKRIRDGEGAWQAMESYLQKQAGLQVTHGVCPECMQKLYPEIYDRVKDRLS